MIFMWTEDLETGVAMIDDQHRELFLRLNALLEACRLQKGREEIELFLAFLDEYVIHHFVAEEQEMAESDYPGISAHKAEHREFVMQMLAIKKEAREYGAGIHVILMTVRASGDWLANHIRKTDKAMAAHLRSGGRGNTAT
jgi:hemerythrin